MALPARKALLLGVGVLLAGAVYVNAVLTRAEATVPRLPLSSFPKVVDGWSGDDQAFTTDVLENLGVDEYLMRRFVRGEEAIWLYLGYYKSQREGAVPHSPKHCYPGSGWTPVRTDVGSIAVKHPGLDAIHPNRIVFARGNDRECVIYWYQSRGRAVANEYVEKAYLVFDAIFLRRSDGALVRLSTKAKAGGEDDAMRRLEAFASTLYPTIPRFVPD